MQGWDELTQLARLMRMSAQTAEEIAVVLPGDFEEICELARRTKEIAEALSRIARNKDRDLN